MPHHTEPQGKHPGFGPVVEARARGKLRPGFIWVSVAKARQGRVKQLRICQSEQCRWALGSKRF